MSGGGCIGGPRRDPGELGRSWKPEDSRELVHECVQALLSGCLRLAAALSGRSWQGMAVPGFLRARTLLVAVPSGLGVGWVAVYCAPAAGVRSVVGGLGRPAAGLGMLAVRSKAGTVGCPYWARSVATVRGSVGGRRLLLAFGNSLGGLGGPVAVRERGRSIPRVGSWAGGACSSVGAGPRLVKCPASLVAL